MTFWIALHTGITILVFFVCLIAIKMSNEEIELGYIVYSDEEIGAPAKSIGAPTRTLVLQTASTEVEEADSIDVVRQILRQEESIPQD